jgi:hypothetical protein
MRMMQQEQHDQALGAWCAMQRLEDIHASTKVGCGLLGLQHIKFVRLFVDSAPPPPPPALPQLFAGRENQPAYQDFRETGNQVQLYAAQNLQDVCAAPSILRNLPLAQPLGENPALGARGEGGATWCEHKRSISAREMGGAATMMHFCAS